jgi:biopolymer transport protein ExbB
LAVGLLGLGLGVERSVTLLRAAHRVDASLAARVNDVVAKGQPADAVALVGARTDPAARILAAGLAATGTHDQREAAVGAAFARELPPLERALTMLGAVAAVAPLLGLLGTVSGMIGTFDVISAHGAGNPRLLSGGISVALITTQLGLIVAVPALLAHAWISRIVERRTSELEHVANVALAASTGDPAPVSDQGEPS